MWIEANFIKFWCLLLPYHKIYKFKSTDLRMGSVSLLTNLISRMLRQRIYLMCTVYLYSDSSNEYRCSSWPSSRPLPTGPVWAWPGPWWWISWSWRCSPSHSCCVSLSVGPSRLIVGERRDLMPHSNTTSTVLLHTEEQSPALTQSNPSVRSFLRRCLHIEQRKVSKRN